MTRPDPAAPTEVRPHTVSVVIPVYRGERTLPGVVAELLPLVAGFVTPDGHAAEISEIVLVHDCGPDDSAATIRALAARHRCVTPVWLSRNFGQHPSTLAGMAATHGDWIVTMDEDGQHDVSAIPRLLDTAMAAQADLVYARPATSLPHSLLRNLSSRVAKRIIALSAGNRAARDFNSFRLVLGTTGRSVAGYAGAGAYLDIAMSWVARRIETCPVELRTDGARPSGYNYRSLFSHFWRMVVSSGTRALRVVSLLGALAAIGGVLLAIYLFVAKTFLQVQTPAGWPSLMVAVLLCSGAILFSLGVIAEYIGASVNMAMGRPLYITVTDVADGPLGRPPAHPRTAAAAPEQTEQSEQSEPTTPVALPAADEPAPREHALLREPEPHGIGR